MPNILMVILESDFVIFPTSLFKKIHHRIHKTKSSFQ